MADSLTCRRDEFSLPEELHYINCARMAPLSKRVERAGIQGLRRKCNPDLIDSDLFFSESDRVRRGFARLIGASDPGRVAIHPSASYGIATVARNSPLEAGQNVVVLHEQFPSNYYSWHRRCEETGAELRIAQPPESALGRAQAWNEVLLEAIDPATAVVAVPGFHWSDGTPFDLEAIGERARSQGAALVIDGTQSVGAVPFDLAKVRPDALICASYKTLHGPYSLALGWYGPRYDDGIPLEENWAMRAGSEDFAGLVDYSYDYQPGAIRYDVGERSNWILNPMAIEALEQIHEWRPERILDYCDRLTSRLFDELPELGFRVEPPEWRSPHLFGLHPPKGLDPKTIHGALAARRVSVSVRGSAVRVSPNVYNHEGDIDALRAALRQGAATAS